MNTNGNALEHECKFLSIAQLQNSTRSEPESKREVIMSLKEAAAFAGISFLTVCCAAEVYAIDPTRLTPAELVSAPGTQTVNSTKAAISRSEFGLRPSGQIASSYGGGIMITNGYVEASMPHDLMTTAVKSVAPASTGNMNISYSRTRPMIPECGPSPFSPAEIEALVSATAAVYAIDPRFAKAIAWAESRFDQVRNSPKGARGPMQLMPPTATALGVQEPCDPKSNIDGGVRHLKALLDEFRNPSLAAAAYNAGRRAVYDNGGIPPFGETIRYVATVINHQLGLELEHGELSPRAARAMKDRAGSGAQASSALRGHGSRFVKGVMHF